MSSVNEREREIRLVSSVDVQTWKSTGHFQYLDADWFDFQMRFVCVFLPAVYWCAAYCCSSVSSFFTWWCFSLYFDLILFSFFSFDLFAWPALKQLAYTTPKTTPKQKFECLCSISTISHSGSSSGSGNAIHTQKKSTGRLRWPARTIEQKLDLSLFSLLSSTWLFPDRNSRRTTTRHFVLPSWVYWTVTSRPCLCNNFHLKF